MQQHALDQLTGVVDRTARMVNQLLDLARIEDGEGTTGAAEPLPSIAQRVVADLRPLATARSVALQIAGDGASLRADPVHLGLALRNVVENAVNAAPPGTAVTLTLSSTGIEIRDAGPGIDPADLPHVTRRFFTGSGSKGSGLGLAIAVAALERLGWALSFPAQDGPGQTVALSPSQRA